MCGSFIARIVLKVSKSQKHILKFSFEPKMNDFIFVFLPYPKMTNESIRKNNDLSLC